MKRGIEAEKFSLSASVHPMGFGRIPPGAQGAGFRAVGALSSVAPADGHDGGIVSYHSALRIRAFFKKA